MKNELIFLYQGGRRYYCHNVRSKGTGSEINYTNVNISNQEVLSQISNNEIFLSLYMGISLFGMMVLSTLIR